VNLNFGSLRIFVFGESGGKKERKKEREREREREKGGLKKRF